jgi:hypothetical protein
MAKDREFREILIDQRIDQSSVLIPKPKPGVYYVRTSSIDSKGYEGEFSKPQSFEIKPPSPPHLEKPEVGKEMIRLRWTSPEGSLIITSSCPEKRSRRSGRSRSLQH